MKYLLQANDFVTSFRNVLGGDFSAALGTITPYILFGIVIAAVVIICVISYRAVMMYRAFGSGMPLGRFMIIDIGTRKHMTGYLSKSEIFNARDDLEDMKESVELKPLVDRIYELIDSNRIFVYEYNIFDWGNAVKGKAKRVRILSDKPLESDENSWIDLTGSRTWRSILNKEYVRNVIGYKNSKYFELKNPDGNFDGYYALAVLPLVDAGKHGVIMTSLISPNIDAITLSPSIPANSKDIAAAASFIELIAEGNRRVRDSKLHQSKLQELLSKEQQVNFALKQKVNHLRRIILQQIVVGYSRQLTPMQQVNWYVWMLGAGVAGLFGHYVIPTIDGVSQTNTPPLLIGGAAILIVIIIKYMLEQKQKPVGKGDVDEMPENSEMIA